MNDDAPGTLVDRPAGWTMAALIATAKNGKAVVMPNLTHEAIASLRVQLQLRGYFLHTACERRFVAWCESI